MISQQWLLGGLTLAILALLMWGRPRYDVASVIGLIGAVLLGLVPVEEAFSGFSHPAVITVALVLVLGAGISRSGMVEPLVGRLLTREASPSRIMLVLCAIGGGMSAFMNNVGALAIVMPLAIQAAHRAGMPPYRMLMPLSFATLLGGTVTLIGTPPNLIVAGFRPGGESFGMFDFAPVGLGAAVIGIAFLALVGWRLVPARRQEGGATALLNAGSYLTELKVTAGSALVGRTVAQLDDILGAEVGMLGLIRGTSRKFTPAPQRLVQADDILVLSADPAALQRIMVAAGLEPAAAKPLAGADLQGEEMVLREYVVLPGSPLEGFTAVDLGLRRRFQINLIAAARRDELRRRRLREFAFAPGDVLLLQGREASLQEFAFDYACLPVDKPRLTLGGNRLRLRAGLVFAAAIAATATGAVPPAIAFAVAVIAYVTLRVIPLRELYAVIDWPVIVLIGALLPIAGAFETTGLAATLAHGIVEGLAQGSGVLALAALMLVTMLLAEILNNSATVAIMCPIGLSIAESLGVPADAALMLVAVGASCNFLTPIGHQNNTIIMGPGGYRFGDYWPLGLPLLVIVGPVAFFLTLFFWG